MISTERVYAQSTNLERNCGESPLSFFRRISAINNLASFHLEGESEREVFRHKNVREQFSRNVHKKFTKIIKQREITNGVVYSSRDLFKTYLIFEQTELSENKYSKINKIQSDLDITKTFPMIHKRQKSPHKTQKSPKIPRKYWKGRGSGQGAAGGSGSSKHQVRQLSHQDTKRPPFPNQNRGGQQRPVKMKERH